MTNDSADNSKISNRTINTNWISNRTYDSKSNQITKLRRSLIVTLNTNQSSATRLREDVFTWQSVTEPVSLPLGLASLLRSWSERASPELSLYSLWSTTQSHQLHRPQLLAMTCMPTTTDTSQSPLPQRMFNNHDGESSRPLRILKTTKAAS